MVVIMSIGDNIKVIRERHGYSQDEFGRLFGVSGKAVSTWENNIKIPRMGAIQQMADHFGIKKSNIIEDDGLDNYEILKSNIEMDILLQKVKDRPGMSILFKKLDKATPEDVLRTVEFLDDLINKD
jgi:transcriptional regulator with XRE-family HTH domain